MSNFQRIKTAVNDQSNQLKNRKKMAQISSAATKRMHVLEGTHTDICQESDVIADQCRVVGSQEEEFQFMIGTSGKSIERELNGGGGDDDDDELDFYDPSEGLVAYTSNGDVIGGSSNILLDLESVTGIRKQVAFDDRRLMRIDFEDKNSLMARHMLSPKDSPDRSAFHRLKFKGAAMNLALTKFAVANRDNLHTVRMEYRAMQQKLAILYRDLCTSRSSDISTVGTLINAWMEKNVVNTADWPCRPASRIDPRLTIFGNMIARYFLQLEVTAFVSTCHQTIFQVVVNALDSYRHALSLHSNTLLSGKHASSKSFTLNQLIDQMIPDTVTTYVRMTKQAGFTDGDMNDTIEVCEEI